MSEAPEESSQPKNEYTITGIYLKIVSFLKDEESEWWEAARKWFDSEYGNIVELSVRYGQTYRGTLINKGIIDYDKTAFIQSLEAVVAITDKAESNIKDVRKIDIARENNSKLRDIAKTTLTRLGVSDMHVTFDEDVSVQQTKDRNIFSVSVRDLLASIENAQEDFDLFAVMAYLNTSGHKYGVTDKNNFYSELKVFLDKNRSILNLRGYNEDEWVTNILSIVTPPLQPQIIDGRMFINAAILSEFKNMYSLADEKKKLHQLCLALYTQLAKEINGDFASQLTAKGQELYAYLQNPTTASTEPLIKSRLHSDTTDFGESDVLNYDLIAENLFSILKDKSTKPPLNIGILAPWGRGKTNLMKRIKAKFDDEAKKTRAAAPQPAKKQPPKLSLLRKWLSEDGIGVQHNLPFATVWFNPWNYQSSDMIWAGLANSVIEQVVEQIEDPVEREIFWMQLRLARIDKDELRRDIQTRFVLQTAKIVIAVFTVALTAILFWLKQVTPALSVLGLGGIPAIIAFIASAIKPYDVKISDAFSKYTKAPKYNEKLGTFHEVEADMNRVLDLCVDAEKPLVVFVDDLDRCSPSKIVEVIEAINVFISGKYNNKCYFILGMDAEVVAGALDVTYEKMKGKLATKESEQGSIGWYFLDKFIQLPFFIPVMSETKKKEYLAGLLTEKSTAAAATGNAAQSRKEKTTSEMKELSTAVLAAGSVKESTDIIKNAELTPEEVAHLDKLILQNQVQSERQNEQIKQQIALYGQFVSSDPRSLKRFANLLRFHCGYQFLRMKKGQTYVEPKVLAKWLVLMLKFPQLVRWIQWDLENKSGLNSNAEEKAILFDQLIDDFISKTDNEKNNEFARWSQFPFPKELNQGKQGIKIEELNELLWFKSPNMFKILMNDYSKEDKFKNALDCNVW